jgi:hypothetical protein
MAIGTSDEFPIDNLTTNLTICKQPMGMTKSTEHLQKCFIFTLLLLGMYSGSTAQNFNWAKAWGQLAWDAGTSITTDGNGNVYTTGYFIGNVDFDPGAGTYYIDDAGNYTVFISKLDASGNFVWAKTFGGADYSEGHAIALDGSGNIYTTGSFKGTVDFDPGNGTFPLTSAGNGDIFISKLDASGNFVWAKQIGGINDDCGHSITMDNQGNVLTTGYFQSSADFDPGTGTFTLASEGDDDAFISKLDTSGNFVWAKNWGWAGEDRGNSVAADGGGNVYSTGHFFGMVDFDPGAGSFSLFSGGGSAAFISKLDASGNFVWAKQLSGNLENWGKSIAVDESGNVYTAGGFIGTVDFNPGSDTFNLVSVAGYYDGYISKLDDMGAFTWAKQIGGTDYDYALSLALDHFGNVYTTGIFSDSVDFDPGAGVLPLVSFGQKDVFVSILSAAGNLVWAEHMGGEVDDGGYSIAVDGSGNVYTTGFYIYTADFDPGPGVFNLTSLGEFDVFVQKTSQPTYGVAENSLHQEIVCYPNPTTGNITVTLYSTPAKAQIVVHNVMGQELSSKRMESANQFDLLIPGPAGVYFVEMVLDDTRRATFKIIKN